MTSNKTLPPYEPQEFPASWASAWGEDRKGLWMTLTVKEVSYTFRWILPGRFMMGEGDLVHSVIITQGFWLGETTVTQAFWEVVMAGIKENPSSFTGDGRPVDSVSWNDAQAFIKQLNAILPDIHVCLPTEAQWEYACRAGTQTRYFFGDEITQNQAHYNQSNMVGTCSVKDKPENDWGLYQMHGNVWEWCQDRYDGKYYESSPERDPSGPSDESFENRVLRGGSWNDFAGDLASGYRYSLDPGGAWPSRGFRVALGQQPSSER